MIGVRLLVVIGPEVGEQSTYRELACLVFNDE